MADQEKMQKLQNLQNLIFYRRQGQWNLKKPLLESKTPDKNSSASSTSINKINIKTSYIKKQNTHNPTIPKQKIGVLATINEEITADEKTKEISSANTQITLMSVSERLRLLLYFQQQASKDSETNICGQEATSDVSESMNSDDNEAEGSLGVTTLVGQRAEGSSDVTQWELINDCIVSQCDEWETMSWGQEATIDVSESMNSDDNEAEGSLGIATLLGQRAEGSSDVTQWELMHDSKVSQCDVSDETISSTNSNLIEFMQSAHSRPHSTAKLLDSSVGREDIVTSRSAEWSPRRLSNRHAVLLGLCGSSFDMSIRGISMELPSRSLQKVEVFLAGSSSLQIPLIPKLKQD